MQAAYQAAVQDGGNINWCCAVCTELDAGTYEDSTLCEPEPEPEPEFNEPSLRSDEPSLVDPNPADTSSDFSFSDVTYEIMEQCLKEGRPKLINTQGYTYNQHRQRGIVTDWQCTVRPKMNPCRATVRQRGCYDFQTGSNLHNHQPQVGASTAAKITTKVKAMAVEDVFRPAPAIVDEVSNTS